MRAETQEQPTNGKPRSGTVSKLEDREPERQIQKQTRKSHFGEMEANMCQCTMQVQCAKTCETYEKYAGMNM